MYVVPLRRLGKQLGCEKIMLKQKQMILYLVSNPLSAYYQSKVFGQMLDYAGNHVRRCRLRETKGKRSLAISNVETVEAAVAILQEIIGD